MMKRFETEKDWLLARAEFITSTEVASLFGLGEYKTAWQLWHEKAGNYSETVEGERPKWGLRLENAIAEGVALDHEWAIDISSYKNCLWHLEKTPIASSIDRKVFCKKRGHGLIECKVVSMNVWRDQFDHEKNVIPARYEFQLQTEMLCTGTEWACLACLVDGQTHIFIRRSDTAVQEIMLKKVDDFWKSVKYKKEPNPDFMSELDQEVIFKMFKEKKIRKEVDFSTDNHLPELCARYRDATADVKMAELRKNALKAEIITKIGDAEKIKVGDDYTIRASLVEEKEISYTRSAYKDFRIFKKETDPTTKKRSAKK